MEEQLWFKSDLDINRALEKQQYDLLIEYAEENQRQLISKAKQNESETLTKALKLATAILKFQEKHISSEKSKYVLFKLGVLSGSIDVLNQMIYEKTQQSKTVNGFKDSIKCIKHLQNIISLLDLYGSLTHSEVSEKLKVNPPTLTEIMKKILPTALIEVTALGKYKLYSLTDEGRRLALYIREVKTENDQLEALFDQLKQYSQQTNDTERIRKHLNSLLKELDGTTILTGEKVSFDFRDIGRNQTHLEVSVESIYKNSDFSTTINGTIEKQVVFPNMFERVLENKRRNEDEFEREVAKIASNCIR